MSFEEFPLDWSVNLHNLPTLLLEMEATTSRQSTKYLYIKRILVLFFYFTKRANVTGVKEALEPIGWDIRRKIFWHFFGWYLDRIFMSLWALLGILKGKGKKVVLKQKFDQLFVVGVASDNWHRRQKNCVKKMSRFAAKMFDKHLCFLPKKYYIFMLTQSVLCHQIYDVDKHQNKDLMPTLSRRWLLFARLQIILPPLLFYKGSQVAINCKWEDSKFILFDAMGLTWSLMWS